MEAWTSNLKQKSKTSGRFERKGQNTELHHGQAKSNVFDTLMPICYVSKICGLLPVKFTRTIDHQLGQIDYIQVVYSAILTLGLAGAQCWGFYRDLRDGWQNSTRLFSKTAITVTSSDVLFVIGVTTLAIMGSPSRWQYLQRALDRIIQADEKLDIIVTRTSSSAVINLRKLSIILITCTMLYLVSVSSLDYASWDILHAAKDKKFPDKGPINYSPMYLMYAVIVAMQMQYAIILMILGVRFDKLNGVIVALTKTNAIIDYFRKDMGLAAQEPRREISRWSFDVNPTMQLSRRVSLQHRDRLFNQPAGDSSDSIEGVTNSNDSTELMIDRLINVHDILCDSAIHINKAFGFQLLMCTLSCLIHLVITLYFLYAEMNSTTSRWYVFMRQIGWIIFHLYKMLLFIQPPYMVANKARNTGSLVSQALVNNWDSRTLKQFERFAMQLLHRPVEFTACGMFYLDRGLFTSIIGAVTTYLVILVQFQSDDDDKETRQLLHNASQLLRNVSGVGAT